MVHQAQVLQVILSEFGQVIAERLPARKQLFVGAETAVERVAPGVDYFRVG